MTLAEMYSIDGTILESMIIPDLSVTTLNKDVHTLRGREWHNAIIRPNILAQCGGFNILADSVDSFKYELSIWSRMQMSTWCDMLRTTMQKYDLLHNYDRTEEETLTHNNEESGNDRRENTSNSEQTATGTSDNELLTSAYNSPSYAPKEKTETANNTSATGRNENLASGTFERSNSGTQIKKIRSYGNVGVTTSQTLIKEEREIAIFNIVQYIINDFKNYFCVLVY